MQHDALLPRPPGGLAPGAVLALLVHGGLIAALALGVNWRMKAPEAVSAELWAAVPQVAAPRAEEPPAPAPTPAPAPPPPRPAEAAPNEAQIATERAERRRAERERQEEADKVKAKAAADEKKREAEAKKAEEARLANSREQQLKRMMGALPAGGPATSTGTANQDAAPSQAYVGQLVRKIRSNWVFSGAINGNPAAEVEVVAAAGGSIIARRLVKSSGDPDYDESVLRAIDRTRTLPRDSDGRVPPSLIITFRPKE